MMNGIMQSACIENLHTLRTNLVALMFMIHPGTIAPLATVYKRMSQAIGLPASLSTKVPSCPEANYYFFLNLKKSVISKVNPDPTTIFLS